MNPVVRDRLVAAGGLVEPASQARELAAAVVGRIVEVNFEEGDHVAAGERVGLIKFGSRTDVILPATANIKVKVGERVRGGASLIATMPEGKR